MMASSFGKDIAMSRQPNLLVRIGRWFRGEPQASDDDTLTLRPPSDDNRIFAQPVRHSFLRPWARQDAAIAGLQSGFTALNELMTSVRHNLDKQSQRQDQLLACLSHLPEALQAIPESHRVQSETLQAIEEQIKHQATQQAVLADIRQRVNAAGIEQRKVTDALREQLEELHQHNVMVADRMRDIGSTMYEISRTSAANTEVLRQLRDTIDTRTTVLEQTMHRQELRTSRMFIVVVSLAMATFLAAFIIGILVLHKVH